MYSVKWDRKVGSWIVYLTDTGKIVGKFETCDAAKKRQHELIEDSRTQKGSKHRL